MLELIKIDKKDESSINYIENIIKNNFDENEYRDSYELYNYSLKKDEFIAFYIKYNNEVVGIINTWNLGECIYVEHFVIEKEYRNKSLGSKSLELLKNTFNKNIILEVNVENTDVDKKRITFYKKNGFKILDIKYYQEAYSDNKNKIEMYLMSTKEFEKKLLDNVVKKLKKLVYKIGD
ncbi:GNAT family N-acetyltransferase [Oceanivirga miroungae]|uniref:N-acetyltransferase domain-containing protein n=1 Tax=Oceanivirga miroungae TaxID=1130046 RepID=A0A6I8MD32_9FUSO|nr:GNAT family N-acetyltransferase [Oceanivirga miroungae]VWL85350.1 hypothetical protein OMES3154_00635 [Oceanivirga miroungae]